MALTQLEEVLRLELAGQAHAQAQVLARRLAPAAVLQAWAPLTLEQPWAVQPCSLELVPAPTPVQAQAQEVWQSRSEEKPLRLERVAELTLPAPVLQMVVRSAKASSAPKSCSWSGLPDSAAAAAAVAGYTVHAVELTIEAAASEFRQLVLFVQAVKKRSLAELQRTAGVVVAAESVSSAREVSQEQEEQQQRV